MHARFAVHGILSFVVFLCFSPHVLHAQITQFPYFQNFDTTVVPLLPEGWSSTQNRIPGTNDFVTTTTAPKSRPQAVRSTNGRITQSLISPLLDFTDRVVDSIMFYERRSSTYRSDILVQASTDGGTSFAISISDTLRLTTASAYVRRAFGLPSLLSGQDSVRIQWRVLADPASGTTSTLNFDDILITTIIQFDAGVSSIRFDPPFPLGEDSMFVIAGIRNYGVQPISNITAEFYDDLNFDSIPQPSELLGEVFLSDLLMPGDSTVASFLIADLPAGEKQIIVRTLLLNDENPANDRRVARIATGVPALSVVINEIMYAPTSPEPEWVEITNTTDSPVNLKAWKISDMNTASRVTITHLDFLLQPGTFAIVAKDSARVDSIHQGIPARVFHVPTMAILNNDSDAVVIFDQRGMVMDSVRYRSTWGGTSGRSLERTLTSGPSNTPSNWGSSTHPKRSTPGRKNSLTPKDFDVSIPIVNFSPFAPIAGDDIVITAIVKNRGRFIADPVHIEFFEDANRDSIAEPSELIFSTTLHQLLPGDSIGVTAPWPSLPFGEHHFIVHASYPPDEDTTNNTRIAVVAAGYLPFTIVVNEIMYGPSGGEPEWLELYNRSEDTVNLRQWKISNRNSATRYTITTTNVLLHPGEYVVVTKDTALLLSIHQQVPSRIVQVPSMPTFLFSNTGDAAVVFDSRNAVMDSVMYATSWGGTGGRSLERIDADGSSTDPLNWGSSLNPSRSTPGRKNSLTPKEFDVAVTSISFTPPHPIVGDTIRIDAVIRNRGLLHVDSVSVELFYDANRDSLPQSNELIFSQMIPSIAPADSFVCITHFFLFEFGAYQFIARARLLFDEDTTNNTRTNLVSAGYPPRMVVINEVMYRPSGGEPEWLEVFNTSSDTINLRHWKVSNRNSASRYTLMLNDLFLPPSAFMVATKDTALFFAVRPDVPAIVVQVSSMPTFLFNNNGDAVVLFDDRGAVIDSVHYAAAWGGTGGRSLERIDEFGASNDSTNWGSSTDSTGATPGKQNSITPVDHDLGAVRIAVDTVMTGSGLFLGVVVANVGRETAGSFSVSLFHDANIDSLPQPDELIETKSIGTSLIPRDSLAVRFTWTHPGYGRRHLIARVDYPPDMRTANNTVYGAARAGYPERSLVINEIMYAPRSGQAEYVELYNRSDLEVDVRDWKIIDMRDANGRANEFLLSRESRPIAPGEFFVLASDSSIISRFGLSIDTAVGYHLSIVNRSSLSLNNDGDDVVLFDLSGGIIDSVRYSPLWHNPQVSDVSGRALERINPDVTSTDPRNWSSSAHLIGGTPGRQNSIFTTVVPTGVALSFSPNPFSPDGDGHEDFTVLSYELPTTAALLRARVFDAKGRLVRTLANGETTGSRGNIIWDGMTDGREKARMGIYVVLLEALDSGGEIVHATKGAVVLAVRL